MLSRFLGQAPEKPGCDGSEHGGEGEHGRIAVASNDGTSGVCGNGLSGEHHEELKGGGTAALLGEDAVHEGAVDARLTHVLEAAEGGVESGRDPGDRGGGEEGEGEGGGQLHGGDASIEAQAAQHEWRSSHGRHLGRLGDGETGANSLYGHVESSGEIGVKEWIKQANGKAPHTDGNQEATDKRTAGIAACLAGRRSNEAEPPCGPKGEQNRSASAEQYHTFRLRRR